MLILATSRPCSIVNDQGVLRRTRFVSDNRIQMAIADEPERFLPEKGKSMASPRSLEELMTPRPVMMPSPDIFDADLAEIEATIRQTVPVEIRKRISVSRNLAVYGAFCYDFISVSVFWSLSCVEMALWKKFAERHPDKAKSHIRSTFGSLARWARDQKLLPDPTTLDAMVRLRNSFAHPKESSPLWNPAMAATIFQGVIDVVNALWPLEVGE